MRWWWGWRGRATSVYDVDSGHFRADGSRNCVEENGQKLFFNAAVLHHDFHGGLSTAAILRCKCTWTSRPDWETAIGDCDACSTRRAVPDKSDQAAEPGDPYDPCHAGYGPVYVEHRHRRLQAPVFHPGAGPWSRSSIEKPGNAVCRWHRSVAQPPVE